MGIQTTHATRIEDRIDDVINGDVNGWQQSQERVLRYLQVLGVPPVRSLEISCEVMRLAARTLVEGSEPVGHPTRTAMRVLREILSKGVPPASGISCLAIRQVDAPIMPCTGEASDRASGDRQRDEWDVPSNLRSRIELPPMPGLKRESMRPAMTWPGLFSRLAAIFSRPRRG